MSTPTPEASKIIYQTANFIDQTGERMLERRTPYSDDPLAAVTGIPGAVIYVGAVIAKEYAQHPQTGQQVITRQFPVRFPISATSVADAFAKFDVGADAAFERMKAQQMKAALASGLALPPGLKL